MMKFTIKSVVGTSFYELEEEKKLLHIVIRKNWKTIHTQDIDLQQINAEFNEQLPEKTRLFPLILSWGAVVLGFLLLLVGMYMIWVDSEYTLLKRMKFTLCVLIAGPMPFFYAGLKYIFKYRTHEQFGWFEFRKINEYDTAFEIHYQLRNRNQAYKLAKLLAEYCHNEPKPVQLQKNITQRFGNIVAELSDNELVLYNSKDVRIGAVSYKDLSAEVIHIVQFHKVRNFFCTALALLFWLPAAVVIIWAAIDSKDWIIISAMLICGVLPGVLGLFFWKKQLPVENFYFIKDRFAPANAIGNNDVYLIVGKQNEVQTEEFIEELQKRLKASR